MTTISRSGHRILPDADALYDWAQLVVKVKEPWARKSTAARDHLLFCYLHLAANPD